ncbi:hypothetical protein AK812_SmicGene47516, partial [Symbiodinium microadriaticum]
MEQKDALERKATGGRLANLNTRIKPLWPSPKAKAKGRAKAKAKATGE